MGCFKPAKNIIWEEVDDELIVFRLDNGKYFRLNSTGLIVWDGIVKRWSEDEIVRQLVKEFGGTEPRVTRDFQDFMQELKSEGLVVYE